jgi:uncharacterized protein YceK
MRMAFQKIRHLLLLFCVLTLPVSGDCTITARVASQTNTSTNAKAGVMIRSDLTAGSAHAMVAMMPNGEARFVYRATAGGHAPLFPKRRDGAALGARDAREKCVERL